jgi:hypothetical protein
MQTQHLARPKRSRHVPSKSYHRILIRDGDEMVVVLPDDPEADRAIAVVPGDYEQAERAAAIRLAQDKALHSLP